jgi:hypothetical protein
MFDQSFGVLLGHHGEELRWNGQIIEGVVIVTDDNAAQLRGAMDFEASNGSTIFLSRSVTGTLPERGQFIQSEDDRWHRVLDVVHEKYHHRLTCEITDGP